MRRERRKELIGCCALGVVSSPRGSSGGGGGKEREVRRGKATHTLALPWRMISPRVKQADCE